MHDRRVGDTDELENKNKAWKYPPLRWITTSPGVHQVLDNVGMPEVLTLELALALRLFMVAQVALRLTGSL